MAHHKSAIKRIKTSQAARKVNRLLKARLKEAITDVLKAKDKATAEKVMVNAVKVIDKVAHKGIIHKNKAANQKSRLQLLVNKLS
jgi:small subunit ribosomal protein S20